MKNPIALSKFMVLLFLGVLKMSSGVAATSSESFKEVSGQVMDADTSEPLPGVNIVLKGTSTGTVTDVSGNYSIEIPEGNAVLIFSFVGYEKLEVSVGDQTNINVRLQLDQNALDEVVVVGYGTQKKSDLTGAVATVSDKEINQLPVDRIEQGLQGRVPGVQVTQTSGAPGGTVRVRVRGSNSIQYGNDPLYVIDGFPVGGSSVFINPNDVESVTVLKDASATAIYGSRGANGVIIITTKKGSSGKTQVDYDFYYGVQQVTRKLDLLNAQEYETLSREFWSNFRDGSLIDRAYTPEQISQMGEGTDWQDAIFRTASIQSHNVSIRGGSENTRFSISGNYFDQDGIIINSNFKKGTLGFNLEHKANERFQLGTSFTTNYNINKTIPHSTTGHINSGVVYAALHTVPTLPVRNPDGSYSSQDKLWTTTGIYANPAIQNPVEMAERSDYKNTNNRILGNLFAQYKITEGLVAKVSAGTYISNARERSYIPSDFVISRTTGGTARIASSQVMNWINENTLTYQKFFSDKHRLKALAGFSLQQETTESVTAGSQDFFTDATGYNNLSLGEIPLFPGSNISRWSLASFLGRVNYDFASRYLVTVSARYDGSSRFGINNRFGFFPSAALAWQVAEEDFLSQVGWLSDLKVRTSIGVTGNQSIPLYQRIHRHMVWAILM